MNKSEFLNILEKRLNAIPKEYRTEILEYWHEIILDKMEEGILEENVVSELDINQIVQESLMDIPLKKIIKERAKRSGWLAFIISTFYIWIPLLAALFAIYISLWSVVVSFGTSAIGCGGLGIMLLIKSVLNGFSVSGAYGILCVGLGIFSLGVGILLGILTIKATKFMCYLTKKIFLKIKLLFIGRGEKHEKA